ncbi:uncharacterized protein LOC131956951 [Physella acuta]|uniref:uncharacterized protein LOC131956951 n=1 Tax=Physella acuta TaxID=109671 RepID=UPI0027DE93E5|nr:uncharacterized protein LOC131956951 [Physella acuta]
MNYSNIDITLGKTAIGNQELKLDFIDSKTANLICTVILQQSVKVALRVLGVVTNLLTLAVFWRSGLNDGISVGFFALTVSNLMCMALYLTATEFVYADLTLRVRPYVSLYWVGYILPFYAITFYIISTLITVFLAVQKCCCVALPLTFKDQFSRNRCIAIIACIYSGIFALYVLYTISVFPFQPGFDYSTNSTRLIFKKSDFYSTTVFPIIKGFAYIFIPIISELIVLFCTILLTIKLEQSAKFRMSATNKKEVRLASIEQVKTPIEEVNTNTHKPITGVKRRNPHSSLGNGKEEKSKEIMSKREMRATQSVNMVAILFVVCNTPDVAVYLASLVVSDFSSSGRYVNTYWLCLELQDLMHVINMIVNLFVYLKYNSKFRRHCVSIFKLSRH